MIQNLTTSPPLRPFQQQALTALHHHRHTILVAPTGSGKSRIFQEYMRSNPHSKTLIISPLNALTRQHEKNIADFLGEDAITSGPNSRARVVSPERLMCDPRIKIWSPDFLVVDEAHCVWEWGDDFRPAFKVIYEVIKNWNIKKSFWCTATLPAPAREEIIKNLNVSPKIKIAQLGSFSLPQNLTLEIKKVFFAERLELIQQFCHDRRDQLGIIFLSTRHFADHLAKYFKNWQIPVVIYHAGMSEEERLNLENQLKHTQKGVILATSAFGMGMDFAQIKYSVLFQPPPTLLSLAQALGRAGRNQASAEGVVFWHEDDFCRYEWLIQKNEQRRNELMQVKEWCRSEANPRQFLENYFNGAKQSLH